MGKKKSLVCIDRSVLTPDNVDFLTKNITEMCDALRHSELIKNVITKIKESFPLNEPLIRCLALGSISTENPAKWQLAFLLLLQKEFSIEHISLYDPAFSDLDHEVLQKTYKMTVDQEDPFIGKNTWYFLPHIPLTVMNSVLATSKPRYLICNNIDTHLTRYPIKEITEKYETLAAAYVRLEERSKVDNFKTPSRRRKKGSLRILIQSVMHEEEHTRLAFIESSASKVHFTKAKITHELKPQFEAAGTSFSDLVLLVLA